MVRQVTLNWTAAGGAGGITVLHYADAAAPVDINTSINLFVAALRPILSSQTFVGAGPEIRDYDTATGVLTGIASLAPGVPLAGTGGSAAVPNAAQGLIRFRTGLVVGRRLLQGRIYVPGMSSNTQLGTGELNTSAMNALTDAGEELRDASSPVVWHRPVNGAGGQASPVATVSAWNEFAVQRRRRSN